MYDSFISNEPSWRTPLVGEPRLVNPSKQIQECHFHWGLANYPYMHYFEHSTENFISGAKIKKMSSWSLLNSDQIPTGLQLSPGGHRCVATEVWPLRGHRSSPPQDVRTKVWPCP